MTHISIHDSEKEGESDASEHWRIDLFVVRDTICAGDCLEDIGKIVSLEVRWRDDSMVFSFIDLRTINVSIFLNVVNLIF